ncbi:MAG: response regulator transcription factor [Faecalicoccus sp.]|nr:response regulator transcription factor [Faecalicoccus sp.]
MIWCVDDDDSIRDIEVYTLQSTGFEAMGFEDGFSMFQQLETEIPDLIVLDIMLSDMDGIDILKKLKNTPRWKSIPVIMATAKGEEIDKIVGLDLGADDYLVKPFGMMEMVSRIKAVLRRCSQREESTSSIKTFDNILLDYDKRTVKIDGEPILLTVKEFEMLNLFISNPGHVFTREDLMNHIWGTDYYGGTRTVDVHITTLRRKMKEAGRLITTIRGIGYCIRT